MAHARQLARACLVSVAVLEYAGRTFLPDADVLFCTRCEQHIHGSCDYRNTHLYGSFEAERWGGLYVYYCPLSLGFIATVVYDGSRAEYAMVTGPIVIGSLADTLSGSLGQMTGAVLALPCRSAEDTTALSKVQHTVCGALSGKTAAQSQAGEAAQKDLHNLLYAAAEETREGESFDYPVEIEKRLRRMIVQGDRKGARELINQLLGQLYFSEAGDLARIRENARALLVLFSRAALDGGADARQIFGNTQSILDNLNGCDTLDTLSQYLTSMFYRFVGYVFDFRGIRHADVVHKVVDYVRAHYAERISMDDLAVHVYLSRSYLSRMLGEALGMSFSEYLAAFRVERGRELLETTTLPLVDIAHQTGFSDQSHFTRMFRRHIGLSPGEYRKRHGRGSEP